MSAEVRVITPSSNHGEWARALRARAVELVTAAGGAVRYPRACVAVLVALAAHAGTDGTCHPSQRPLAGAVRYSQRHVERALDDAVRAGLLTRAVPRYGARVLGATTRYALPWWAVAAREGLRGVARVQSELPIATDPQAAAVARALRETRPGALLGAVVRCLPSEAAVSVLRAGVDVMLPRRPVARTALPPAQLAAAQLADAAALREIAAAVEALPGPGDCSREQTTPCRKETPQRDPLANSHAPSAGHAPSGAGLTWQNSLLGERAAALQRRLARA